MPSQGQDASAATGSAQGRIFLEDSPAEAREGGWELLQQPPTQGGARGSALVPNTNQSSEGSRDWGQPEEQGDAPRS